MLHTDRLVSSSLVVNACKGSLLVALVALMPACVVDAEELDDVDVDPVPAHTTAWDGTLNTNQAPEYLWVKANSTTNSGTTNDITLRYWNSSGKYSCTITSTIFDGGERGCAPTRYDDYSTTYDYFKVGYANSNDRNDGLLVTQVSVEFNNIEYVYESFTEMPYSGIDCTGCSGILDDEDCNSCWIDGDDHNKCAEMRIKMNSVGNIECSSSL